MGKMKDRTVSKDFKFTGDNYEEIEDKAEEHAHKRGVPSDVNARITYHRGGKLVRFTWVWIEGL